MMKSGFCLGRVTRILLVLAAFTFWSGASASSQEYTNDGLPSPGEEEIRWHLNRGRFDSASENQERGTQYTDVPAFGGPLAPANSLALAARHHSEDMARNNVFQHDTIPGSAYYNPTTQPKPWDRMLAEGYDWVVASENIAAGYENAKAAYVGWWNSSGHRHNMFNGELREIGNGYFFWAGSTYQRYFTMDLGSAEGKYFLTDTLFDDANGNGAYDQGEGLGGIGIKLVVNNVVQSAYDVSSSVGSFAVPIGTVPAGSQVKVLLTNTTSLRQTVSIPRDYWTFITVTLAPGESRLYGKFTQPGGRNVGFREVAPSGQITLKIGRTGQNVVLSWPSETGTTYQVQWSSDLTSWSSLGSPLPGTGQTITLQDPVAGSRRCYRLQLLQ